MLKSCNEHLYNNRPVRCKHL